MWLYQHPGSSLIVIRAYCHHSLTNDPALQVFVCLNCTTGDVYTAQCNCVSGLGAACSHIAALLFALEDVVRKGLKELPVELSKTSKPMEWNKPPKKHVSPLPVKGISFTKPSFGKGDATATVGCAKRNFDPRAPTDRTLSQPALVKLQEDLKDVFPDSGLLQYWDYGLGHQGSRPSSTPLLKPTSGTEEDEHLAIESLILFNEGKALQFTMPEHVPSPSDLELDELMAEFKVISPNLLQSVEERTRGQATNQLWFDIRNGRITSSRFGQVLHRRDSTPSERLVAEIMGYTQSIPSTPAIRWGRNNEHHARKAYLDYMLAKGHDLNYQDSGLHLYPPATFLGASTDGIIVDSTLEDCSMGCLEIKCPFSIGGTSVLDLTPAEIAKSTTFYLGCVQGSDKLQLKRSHPYFAQVQGEMAIVGTEWCDFVVYTPVGLHVERVTFDCRFWEDELFPSLERFFRNHVLPELVTATIFRAKYAPRLPAAVGVTETADVTPHSNEPIDMNQETT